MMDERLLEKLNSLPVYGEAINWNQVMEDKPLCIVGAFHNADVEVAMKQILVIYQDEIADGLSKIANILEVENTKLITDDTSSNDYFIHVREYKHTLFVHPVTLLNISRVLNDKEPLLLLYVNDKGIQEYYIGTPWNHIIQDKNAKAILINHKYYPVDLLNGLTDTAINYGNGKIQVIDQSECILQSALEETNKLRSKSCGICTFCREGLYQISTTLNGMMKPGTKMEKLSILKEIGEAIGITYMCSVGACAALPLLSAYELFPKEVEAHCGRGSCPSGQCKGFMNIYIDPHKCEGCGECIDVCPKNCIEGKTKYISMIDEFDCDKCGQCVKVCENEAIVFTSNRIPKLPKRLTKVGRFK